MSHPDGGQTPPGGNDPQQTNINESATLVDNRGAQSAAAGGVAGPIVAPITPQVGTNVNGPANVDAGSNQAGSGNGASGDVLQSNFNSSMTSVDNQGAQSQAAAAGLVGVGAAGPVVVPVSPQVGTNVNGPGTAQLFSNQRDSGNGFGGGVGQLNTNRSATFLNNAKAQSDAFGGGVLGVGVAGPVVAPIAPQVGTNVSGPLDVQGISNQDPSGNGNGGNVSQANLNDALTQVDDRGAQSDSAAVGLVGAGGVAVSGPIVAPVTPQVGTNVNGPANGNLFANQRDSGNAGSGSVAQVNGNSSHTLLDNDGAQSNAFAGSVGAIAGAGAVSGPIVAPISPQVGTNLNGRLNLNGGSNQFDSGNGANGDIHQLNWQSTWTGVSNLDAQSNSTAGALGYGVIAGGEAGAVAVSGPIVAPIAPQVGTNGVGPANGNLLSNQHDSGNAPAGAGDQLNGNQAFTWLKNEGAQSNAFAASGDLSH